MTKQQVNPNYVQSPDNHLEAPAELMSLESPEASLAQDLGAFFSPALPSTAWRRSSLSATKPRPALSRQWLGTDFTPTIVTR